MVKKGNFLNWEQDGVLVEVTKICVYAGSELNLKVGENMDNLNIL